MKIADIVTELQGHFPGKKYEENFIISDIDTARAAYASKNFTFSNMEGLQTLENIKLSDRQETEFGIRYITNLPSQILTGKEHQLLIQYLGKTDWKKNFRPTDFSTVPYLKHNRYTGRNYSCYYFFGSELHVVFYNEPEVDEISIKAVFSNPLSLNNFNKEIDDYPLSNSILRGQIIFEIIKRLKSYGW